MRSATKSKVAEAVKKAVLLPEPSATIVLFGSRASGHAPPDSDWDFLVLLDGTVDRVRNGRLRRALYEVEWELGQVISSIVLSREEWESPRQQATPFCAAVFSGGVTL